MATLREQIRQFNEEGTKEQTNTRLKQLYSVDDLSALVPFLDRETTELTEVMNIGFPVGAPSSATTPVKAPTMDAKEVTPPTPSPQEKEAVEPPVEALSLPGEVTPQPDPVLEAPRKAPEPTGFEVGGTVRVPLLEEAGIIKPFKGDKDTVLLDIGPSVEKTAGMLSGVLDKGFDVGLTALEAMGAAIGIPGQMDITVKQATPKLEKERQLKLKRVLGLAVDFDKALKEKEERSQQVTDAMVDLSPIDSGFAFAENTITDVKDILLGLGTMLNEIGGIEARRAGTDRRETGAKFGGEMAKGIALITGSVFEGAEDSSDFGGALTGLAKSFASRPLTTMLTLHPLIKAGQRAANTARQKSIFAKAEQASQQMWERSGVPGKWSDVTDLARNNPASKKLVRLLEDPTEMATPEGTRIAQRVIDDPRQVKEQVVARTEGFKREIGREAATELVPELEQRIATPTGEQQPQVFDVRAGSREQTFVSQERLNKLVEDSITNPDELAAYQKLKTQYDSTANQQIQVGPRRADLVLDTGFGGAFDAVLRSKGMEGQVVADISRQAADFVRAANRDKAKRPAELTKAAILEIIDNVDTTIADSLSGRELTALTKSAQRQATRLDLQDLMSNYTSGTARTPKVRTQVFELTEQGVVRAPFTTRRLAREAIEIYQDAQSFGEFTSGLEFRGVNAADRATARLRLGKRGTAGLGPRLDLQKARAFYPELDNVVSFVNEQVSQVLPRGVNIETGPYSRNALTARFIDALGAETTALLRDTKVASIMRNALLKKAKEAGVPRAARRKLVTEFNDFIGDTAAVVTETVFPEFQYNGKTFFGKKDFLDTYKTLSAKQRSKAAQFATTRIGFEIAAELETIKQVGALNQELNRFVTDTSKLSPENYAISVATEVLINEQPRPLITPFNGKELSSTLTTAGAELAEVIAKKTGRAPAEVLQQINGLANYLERFTPMNKTVQPLTKTRAPGLGYPRDLARAFAEPAFNRSVFWDISSKNGVIQSGLANWLVSVGNLFKKNVVARGTPALVNNNISNVLAVSAERGVTPPTVLGSIAKFNSELVGYFRNRTPKATANVTMEQALLNRELLKALDEEGIFGSTDVRQDFARTAKADSILKRDGLRRVREEVELAAESRPVRAVGKVREKILSPFDADTFGEFFEYTYTRLGDDLFKGESGYRRAKRTAQALQDIAPGYHVNVKNSRSQYWQITKKGNDNFVAELYANNGKKLGERVEGSLMGANNKGILKLLAKDGVLKGNELFFDYGRVGNWTKILRSLPITNLASSFHTWYFKALDIPFFKKGLVQKTMLNSDTIMTNDPRVRATMLEGAYDLAMRKAQIANSVVGVAQQRQDEKTVATPLSFSPSRQELGLIMAATDPDYVLQYALGSRDFTDPSMVGLKVLQKGLLTLRDAAEFFGMDPKQKELYPPREELEAMSNKQWERLQRQRKLFLKQNDGTVLSPKEALELAGIGGSISLSFFDYIRDAEKQGRVLDFPSLVRQFSRVLIGSNNARFADVLIAAATEGSAFTRLGKQEMRRGFRGGQTSPNQSNFTQYAIKTLFGLGWNSILYFSQKDELKGTNSLGAVTRYISGLKAEMKANLVRPKEDEARRLLVLLQKEKMTESKREEMGIRLDELEADIETMLSAIDEQGDLLQDRFEVAYENLWRKTYGPLAENKDKK